MFREYSRNYFGKREEAHGTESVMSLANLRQVLAQQLDVKCAATGVAIGSMAHCLSCSGCDRHQLFPRVCGSPRENRAQIRKASR